MATTPNVVLRTHYYDLKSEGQEFYSSNMKFSHYWKHVTFISRGDRERMKVQSDLIDVAVAVDLE